jgi:hypothetical protein
MILALVILAALVWGYAIGTGGVLLWERWRGDA